MVILIENQQVLRFDALIIMDEDQEISPVEEFLNDLYELTSSYENDLSKQALAEMLRDRADFLLRD